MTKALRIVLVALLALVVVGASLITRRVLEKRRVMAQFQEQELAEAAKEASEEEKHIAEDEKVEAEFRENKVVTKVFPDDKTLDGYSDFRRMKPEGQACPGKIQGLVNTSKRLPDPSGIGYLYAKVTTATVENVSRKPIDAIILRLQRVDALGDEIPGVVGEFTIEPTTPIKPGDEGFVGVKGDGSPFLTRSIYELWVYGVRYDDGDVWVDNRTHSCAVWQVLPGS